MSFSSDGHVVMTIEHNHNKAWKRIFKDACFWKVKDKSKTVWGMTATTSIPTRAGVLYNYIQDVI